MHKYAYFDLFQATSAQKLGKIMRKYKNLCAKMRANVCQICEFKHKI